MAEMDELCKRTWAAIDELDACVKEQKDEDEDAEYATRVNTVAMTMMGLGLGLASLGDLACYLSEMEKICEAETSTDNKDAVTEDEWAETILADDSN